MNYCGRKNVPKIFRENVSDQKVNFIGSVWDLNPIRSMNAIVISSRRLRPYRFDLSAGEDFSDANDHVVAVAVSPRLGDGEAEARRFAHESELGKLAAMRVVEFDFTMWFTNKVVS